MPEMPEVESVVRKLRRSIVGKSIVEVRLSGLPLRKPVEDTFASRLIGHTIRKIHRRGKYMIVEMEPCAYWLIHLGMSGRVLYRSRPCEEVKHTHAIIRFSDASELEYRDPRRFGLLRAYDVAQLRLIPELRFLGAEPLSRKFRIEWLLPRLQRSRQEIKSFLLDQRLIAGLGNIYACEALYHARIHPARRCFTIGRDEAARLVGAIRTVLRTAIRNRGTSFSDFMDSDGEPGENQTSLGVFQKAGEKCRRCRSTIRRLRQGNRSSFFCPRCQRQGRMGRRSIQ